MIYFIRAAQVGRIKIGFVDSDPFKRLDQLQTGSPVELILVGTMPGDRSAERALHERFAAHRVHGEWFKPAPELVAFILGSCLGARLNDVRDALAMATPGPWTCTGLSIDDGSGRSFAVPAPVPGAEQAFICNFRLITSARRDIPFLLSVIDWLTFLINCDREV